MHPFQQWFSVYSFVLLHFLDIFGSDTMLLYLCSYLALYVLFIVIFGLIKLYNPKINRTECIPFDTDHSAPNPGPSTLILKILLCICIFGY